MSEQPLNSVLNNIGNIFNQNKKIVYPLSDKSDWGPSFWKYGTSMAANYPNNPTEKDRVEAKQGLVSFVRNIPCFPAGYKIVTSEGLKPIEQIKEGDLVYTHKGRFKPVVLTMKRWYSGDIVNVRTWGSNYISSTTPEHPYLTDSGWVNAKELTKNHRVLFTSPITTNDITEIPVHYIKRVCGVYNNGYKTVYEYDSYKTFILNESFLKIIGYYLAEGDIAQSKKSLAFNEADRIRMSFGKSDDEYNIAKDAFDSLKNMGLKPHMELDTNGWRVRVCNKALSTWFMKEFGKGAKNKKIPLWIINLPNEKLKILLDAYILGDGYDKKDDNHVGVAETASISEELSFGIYLIASKLGYKTGISKRDYGSESTILGRTVNINPVVYVNINQNKNNYNNVVKNIDGVLHQKIKDITVSTFEGMVYNISVLDDNSYCSMIHTVHNCLRPCQKEATQYIRSNPPDLTNKNTYFKWFTTFENFVRERLGQPKLEFELKNNPDIEEKVATIRRNITSDRLFGSINTDSLLDMSDIDKIIRKKTLDVPATANNNDSPVVDDITSSDKDIDDIIYQLDSDLKDDDKDVDDVSRDNAFSSVEGMFQPFAEIFNLKPVDLNLAYTPVLITSIMNHVAQSNLSPFANMVIHGLSAIGLLAATGLFKSNIGYGDRLLLQHLSALQVGNIVEALNSKNREDIVNDGVKLFNIVTGKESSEDIIKTLTECILETPEMKKAKQRDAILGDFTSGNPEQLAGYETVIAETGNQQLSVPDIRGLQNRSAAEYQSGIRVNPALQNRPVPNQYMTVRNRVQGGSSINNIDFSDDSIDIGDTVAYNSLSM